MEGMLSLFETIVHSNDNVLLQTLLKTCHDHQPFTNKVSASLQSVIASINSKLNSAATRHGGLLLLKIYLPQCSINIYGDNVISWMQQCLKCRDDGENEHRLTNTSFQVLKMLLQMSEKLPEMKRPISGFIVPKIIDEFQQLTPQETSVAALECLEVLMFNYGSSCGQQKNILEKCVLQYVDCFDVNLIKRVARCVAFLPLLGGGGSFGVSHVARWKEDQQKVCTTLHHILDELFDNVRELPNSYRPSTSTSILPLPCVIDGVPLVRVHYLANRFINVATFLQAMLISEFPVDKMVLSDVILGVICRGLAVTSNTLGKKVSTDLLMVGALIPQVHIALLKILESLIKCCGCNLLPHAPVICKLILQTLKWTSVDKWIYGLYKPYGHLRLTAYSTLILWLQTSNCGSCVEIISEDLVSVLMQDVRFEKEAVTLNIQNGKGTASKKKHQKHKQKISEQEIMRNFKNHFVDEKSNNEVCRAALQVLQWMLHSAATFIKPTVHRLLQETTVALLHDIQQTSNVHDVMIPYREASCRLELYHLLQILVLEPHPIWPPPTQFALHILSAGRRDSNLQISSFCTAALLAVEKIVHPASGTLQFPVSLEEMLDSVKHYNQTYHKFGKECNSSMLSSDILEGEDEDEDDEDEDEAMEGNDDWPGHVSESEMANAGSDSSSDVVVVYEGQTEEVERDEASESFSDEEMSYNNDIVSLESCSTEQNVCEPSEYANVREVSTEEHCSDDVDPLMVDSITASTQPQQEETHSSVINYSGISNQYTSEKYSEADISPKEYNNEVTNKSTEGEVNLQTTAQEVETEEQKDTLQSNEKEVESTNNKCKVSSRDENAKLSATEETNNLTRFLDEGNEPQSKKIKLDLPNSSEVINFENETKVHKINSTDSHEELQKLQSNEANEISTSAAETTVPKHSEQVNGTSTEATDEEILSSFVDEVAE